jgi:hypothetical protein
VEAQLELTRQSGLTDAEVVGGLALWLFLDGGGHPIPKSRLETGRTLREIEDQNLAYELDRGMNPIDAALEGTGNGVR